ncbi:hypothetical protein [Sporosarcina sp. ITBMC105]
MTAVKVGAWTLVPSKSTADPAQVEQAKAYLTQVVAIIEAKEGAQHGKTA